MAWLDTNRPARSQFRRPRREAPSGVVVVHTAENAPDFVAFDGGAEAVANFVRTRSDVGSYHDLVDSDSALQLVAYDCEAYHDGTGSNRHSYGLSVATRADVWPLAPKAWRDGAILQAAMAAARYARWLKDTRGITIPARRINRAQSEMRRPGFLSHAERDPARRTDPGAGFPWVQFLDTFARLTSQAPIKPPPPEEDMAQLFKDVDEFEVAVARVVDGRHKTTGTDTRQGVFDLARDAAQLGGFLAWAEDAVQGDPVYWVTAAGKWAFRQSDPLHMWLKAELANRRQDTGARRLPVPVLDQIPTIMVAEPAESGPTG
jgi:hypothetical protein